MRPIVVGTFGRSADADALALGEVLAEAGGAEIVVCAAAPAAKRRLPVIDAQRAGAERAPSDSTTTKRAAWPSGGEPSLPNRLRRGGLHQLADQLDASMIVVGRSPRATRGPLAPARLPERTLRRARRPVAIAPRGYAEEKRHPWRVGIAYDCSVEGRHVLRASAGFVAALGATAVVISVIDTTWLARGADDPAEEREAREACETTARALEEAANLLIDLGLDPGHVRVDRRDGMPDRELVSASRDLDVLVLGSPADGPLLRVRLGAVSTRVVRAAACPLLVLPRAAVDARGGTIDAPDGRVAW